MNYARTFSVLSNIRHGEKGCNELCLYMDA